MKIKRLELKNFKSAPNMKLDLDDRPLVLLADNGKGKTSVLNAFRYLLTGNLPNNPVKYGENSLYVSGVLDDGQDTTIERTSFLPDTFRIDGEDVTEKNFVQEVKRRRDRYGTATPLTVLSPSSNAFFYSSPDVLWDFLETGKAEGKRIAGVKNLTVQMPDGTQFYELRSKPSKCVVDGKTVTAKSMTELLGSRMNGNPKAFDIVTSSEVLSAMQMPDFSKYLISILPVSISFSTLSNHAKLTEEEQEILQPLFPAEPNPISIADVQSAYKTLYKARTDIRRSLDEWEKKSIYDGEILPKSSAEYQKELDALNKTIGAAKATDELWSIYEHRLKERENSAATYQEWVREYNALKDVKQPDTHKLENLRKQESDLREKLDSETKHLAALQQANKPLKEMLSNLNSTVCPLCDRIVCNTDKSSVRNELTQAVSDNDRLVHEAEQIIGQINEQIDLIVKQEDEAKDAANRYQAKADLYAKINSLKSAIPPAPEKPQPKQDISNLESEAAELQEKLRKALSYEASLKAKEQYEKTKKQYDLYNALVQKTEPKKGVLTNSIVELLLDPFKTQVNSFAKSILDDVEIRFGMDEEGNGLQVYCKPHGRNTFLNIDALSTGERMLALMSLMDLISNISNAKTLVFDCLESFDDETIDKLFSMLTSPEAKNQYDNILISAVGHKSIVDIAQKCGSLLNVVTF